MVLVVATGHGDSPAHLYNSMMWSNTRKANYHAFDMLTCNPGRVMKSILLVAEFMLRSRIKELNKPTGQARLN